MALNAINFDVSTALVSLAAQAAGTVNSKDQANIQRRGVKIVVNITAIGATTNLTVTIQGKDIVSGQYYTILASVAVTVTGTTVLTVYPGITATANVSASDVLPATWRVQAVVAGTNTVTATVSASEII